MTRPTSTLLSDRIAPMPSHPRADGPPAGIDAGILLAARIEAGLSQRELAARAGTSGATIAAYERGTKEPRLSTLLRLLSAAGMRLELSYAPALSSANGDLTREDRRSLALHRVIAARFAGDPRAVSRKAVRNLKVMRRGGRRFGRSLARGMGTAPEGPGVGGHRGAGLARPARTRPPPGHAVRGCVVRRGAPGDLPHGGCGIAPCAATNSSI